MPGNVKNTGIFWKIQRNKVTFIRFLVNELKRVKIQMNPLIVGVIFYDLMLSSEAWLVSSCRSADKRLAPPPSSPR